jgi:predicted nucleotide-binding protein
MPVDTVADRAALLGAFRTWDDRNRRLLEQSFEPVAWHESSPKAEYAVLQELELKVIDELTADNTPVLGRVADEKARKLQSIRDSLDIYEVTADAKRNATRKRDRGSGSERLTLFLVHGRDIGAREEVRRFLERVCAAPVVVLADQPSRGLTIIEKLESQLPESAFVVVVLTADDEGRLKGSEDMGPRARQNVIFELGYAVGSLGRSNVAVLFEDGVELPSDYYGVGYVSFDDSGGWKLALVAELKAAGIDADANRAVE